MAKWTGKQFGVSANGVSKISGSDTVTDTSSNRAATQTGQTSFAGSAATQPGQTTMGNSRATAGGTGSQNTYEAKK